MIKSDFEIDREIMWNVMYNDEFAIYIGDKFIYMGRIDDCAKFLNVHRNYIYLKTTYNERHKRKIPYNERLIIIRVERLKDKDIYKEKVK